MEEQLASVVWDAQQKAALEPIKRFTEHLRADDMVVTFNYDTLIECALSQQGKTWDHGLNDRSKDSVTVLKMHGSLDRILLKRTPKSQMPGFVKLFSKRDENVEVHGANAPQEEEYAWELWRARDAKTCNEVIEMHKRGITNFRYFVGLAGLGRYKPLHQLPGSASTWFGAFKALDEADEICVIGFSMSPYDTMTRLHFTGVMRRRNKPPLGVVVIDPGVVNLAPRFFSVFGYSIKLMSQKAEDVDWGRLLD